jgi:hypothetical protein
MRTILKIILILAGLFVFLILFSIAKGVSGQSSGIGGIFGLILIVGFFAAFKAIWKYNPDRKDNSDKHELDKS